MALVLLLPPEYYYSLHIVYLWTMLIIWRCMRPWSASYSLYLLLQLLEVSLPAVSFCVVLRLDPTFLEAQSFPRSICGMHERYIPLNGDTLGPSEIALIGALHRASTCKAARFIICRIAPLCRVAASRVSIFVVRRGVARRDGHMRHCEPSLMQCKVCVSDRRKTLKKKEDWG